MQEMQGLGDNKKMNPLQHFIKKDKGRNYREPNDFEMEQHADDDIHCERCGTKIRYSHGDTELCSACKKYNRYSRRM